MTALDTFAALLAHGDRMNDVVYAAAGQLSDEQLDRPLDLGLGSARRLARHVLAGEATWLARMQGDAEAAWPDEHARMTIADMRAAFAPIRAARDAFLATLTPARLAARQPYRDSKGTRFTATLHEMLLQDALHALHHRAQLVNAIRRVGGTPPDVDYMYAARQPA